MVVTFVEHVSAATEVVYWALMAMIILFLAIMGLIVTVFIYPVVFVFSDIKHLIEFDKEVENFLSAKADEEKKKAEEDTVKD